MKLIKKSENCNNLRDFLFRAVKETLYLMDIEEQQKRLFI